MEEIDVFPKGGGVSETSLLDPLLKVMEFHSKFPIKPDSKISDLQLHG